MPLVGGAREGLDPPVRHRGLPHEARLPACKLSPRPQPLCNARHWWQEFEEDEVFPNMAETVIIKDTWEVISKQVGLPLAVDMKYVYT